ncbi:MAG: hypothetical protein JJT78_09775 [Leptospira sp.]|nr:hypothetical protein [Leptospira sp.]
MIEKEPTGAKFSDQEKINEFIEKIKTGEIYGEIQYQLEENLRKRKTSPPINNNKNIERLQEKIAKKEEDITRILGEIIRYKNELSLAIEKELNDKSGDLLKP